MTKTASELMDRLEISFFAANFLVDRDAVPPIADFPADVTDGDLIKIIQYYYFVSPFQAAHIVSVERHNVDNPDLQFVVNPVNYSDSKQRSKKKLDSEEEKEPSDLLVEQAIATSGKPLNALVKPIKSWMQQFNSLEEVRANLPQLYDRLNGDAFGEHLEQWMLLSHLAGQSEVVEEVYGGDRTEASN